MPTAIGSKASRKKIDSMDRNLEILDKLMSQLNSQQQQSIINFADYLVHQSKTLALVETKVVPELIDRPAQETVTEAIERLKQSYYMLDTDDLLKDVAALMGKHILQGLEASLVIDELQLCFQSYYRNTINND